MQSCSSEEPTGSKFVNEEKERNERVGFDLSNPRKGKHVRFGFSNETRRTLGRIISPRGEIPCCIVWDATSIRVCGWINIARGA